MYCTHPPLLASSHLTPFTLSPIFKTPIQFKFPTQFKSLSPSQVLQIPAFAWRPLVSHLLAHVFRGDPWPSQFAEMILLQLAKDTPEHVLYPVVVEARAHAAGAALARPALAAATALLREHNSGTGEGGERVFVGVCLDASVWVGVGV